MNNIKYRDIYKQIDSLLNCIRKMYSEKKNDEYTKYVNLCYNTILNDLYSMKSFFKAQEEDEINKCPICSEDFKFYLENNCYKCKICHFYLTKCEVGEDFKNLPDSDEIIYRATICKQKYERMIENGLYSK